MGFVQRIKELKNFRKNGIPSDGESAVWEKPYETLRKKWVEVPTTAAASEKTTRLLGLPDHALLAEWEKARKDITTGSEFAHRGWYHALYADGMRGKKVMDIGSGFGVDSITFAQHGARLTFVDLVETNLKVLERLCGILGLREVRFVHFQDLSSLVPLDNDYDVIMAMGSLHHAPARVIKPEIQELVRHLECGGGDGCSWRIQGADGYARGARPSASGVRTRTGRERRGPSGTTWRSCCGCSSRLSLRWCCTRNFTMGILTGLICCTGGDGRGQKR